MISQNQNYVQVVSERPGSGTGEKILVDAYGKEWKLVYGFSDASNTTIPQKHGIYDGFGIRID